MIKTSKLVISSLILTTLTSINLATTVDAQPTTNLTVVVNGVRHQKGEVCFRIFSNENGFPQGDTDGVESGCTKITGTTVKKQFSGLKPGTYAVAVLDDQNGDHKLHTNFFGIPEEGFGISKNPRVSALTGAPKFHDASFPLTNSKTIYIKMKYRLD